MDYRDLAIEMLAAREVDQAVRVQELEAERAVLIDQLADLIVDYARLSVVAEEELCARIAGDVALARANAALRRAGLRGYTAQRRTGWTTTTTAA